MWQVQADTGQAPECRRQPLPVGFRQRRSQDRGDIRRQVRDLRRAEQRHVSAGLMPGKTVGNVDNAGRTRIVQQKAQRLRLHRSTMASVTACNW